MEVTQPHTTKLLMNLRSLTAVVAAAATALSFSLPSASETAETPLSAPAALQNGTYDIPSYGPVTLSQGRHRDNAQGLTFTLDETHFGLGDLNGDGRQDAAVILTVTPDGEEEPFTYVAAVTNIERQSPQPLTTAFVGRKLRVSTLAIERRQVMVELLFFKPQDPLCCPSEALVQTYRLNESLGRLEIASLAEGGLNEERDSINRRRLELDVSSGSDDPNRGDRNFTGGAGIRFPL